MPFHPRTLPPPRMVKIPSRPSTLPNSGAFVMRTILIAIGIRHSELAGFGAEIPEVGHQSGVVKNRLCFGDGPLAPVLIGMRPVPGAGKACDLMQRNYLAARKPMPVAPLANFFR